ncbi:MAG TPA: glutamyl-tRNA reductase [bacterium]|nr:glutamyl-tRNA reductase [bacterium]
MLAVVGLSHRTAPLRVRERLAFSERELPATLSAITGLDGVRESLVLSTCNRTEVYLVASERPPVTGVLEVLGRSHSFPPQEFRSCVRVLEGEAAARHALRVASGLESLIVGEAQILGQVRRAYGGARTVRAAGPVLNRLMQVAIACGRRVRTETDLGRRTVSIPHAAAALVQRTLGLGGRRVVIVGAGEMAALVAKVFSQGGATITAVANRSVENARVLAARHGARSAGLPELPALLVDAEVVVVSTAAATPVVTRDILDAAGGRDGSLLVIDIGVPRGVAADAATLPGVTLYDLDALAPIDAPAAEGASAPTAAPAEGTADVRLAEDIVEEALEAFVRWLASRAAVPVIAALHQRAERIVEDELERARSRLSRLDERERRAVRGVVEGALRKLLHGPFVRLRARGGDERAIDLARELFDLNGEVVSQRDE